MNKDDRRISKQLAHQVGYDTAEAYMIAGQTQHWPPILNFHQQLQNQIPDYNRLSPDDQSEFIMEAVEGWEEWHR